MGGNGIEKDIPAHLYSTCRRHSDISITNLTRSYVLVSLPCMLCSRASVLTADPAGIFVTASSRTSGRALRRYMIPPAALRSGSPDCTWPASAAAVAASIRCIHNALSVTAKAITSMSTTPRAAHIAKAQNWLQTPDSASARFFKSNITPTRGNHVNELVSNPVYFRLLVRKTRKHNSKGSKKSNTKRQENKT